MMGFPSKETIEHLREKYPAGCRVELIHMSDPYNTKLREGSKGTVTGVDDVGTIHVNWDCGSSLGVAFGEDSCRRLNTVTTVCYGETKVWDSRAEAEAFFMEGIFTCEGAEMERYTRVLLALKSGLPVCKDTE